MFEVYSINSEGTWPLPPTEGDGLHTANHVSLLLRCLKGVAMAGKDTSKR